MQSGIWVSWGGFWGSGCLSKTVITGGIITSRIFSGAVCAL